MCRHLSLPYVEYVKDAGKVCQKKSGRNTLAADVELMVNFLHSMDK